MVKQSFKNIETTADVKDASLLKSSSRYVVAKKYKDSIILLKRNIKDFLLISLGILSASFGLKGFLLVNHFIDGGVTGISLLISRISNIPLSFLIIIINIPFIILGYNIIGKQFAIKTIFSIIGLSICLANLQFPIVTNNDVLVAVFGGIFLGAGIGLSIRGGAVIDGTEIFAIYLSKKIGVTIGDIIILINIFIFSSAVYFLSVEIALFSMITYFAASKTLNFIIEGIDEYIGVTIVSTHFLEIKNMIVNKMGRGITVYKGEKGYGSRGEMGNVNILYTVITRLEVNKLNTEIERLDPNAFVVMNSVKDTKGGMIKKRSL